MKGRLLLLIPALAFAACNDRNPAGIEANSGMAEEAVPSIGVMTWNVYVGARVEELLLVSDPNQIPFAVASLMNDVLATDFEARAQAIADRIAETRPDVISLQEVSLFRVQSPGDFLAGNPTAASETFLDYLAVLDDALSQRGLSYEVAARSENLDIELPIVNFSTGGLDDVRLTDYDVILVREGREYANPADGHYQAQLPISLGGVTIFKPSGWASVDVIVGGEAYRVVNTHLEPADIAPGVLDPQLAALHAAQAAELEAILDASPHPVILTGDLNSAASGNTTSTYEDLIQAGFVDAWTQGRPTGLGYTSHQAPDLTNAVSQLFHRIDYVLFRDSTGPEPGVITGAVKAELVGEEPTDRTPSGLWPSDHAGVFVDLTLAPRHGLR